MRIGDYKYRFIDQPGGWLGAKTKVDVPYLTNLRLDPFERTGWPSSGTKTGAQQYFDWFKYEFWRFVFVQQQVEKLAMTAIEFPPMQKGASFNLDAVKDEDRGGQDRNGQVTDDRHDGRPALGRPLSRPAKSCHPMMSPCGPKPASCGEHAMSAYDPEAARIADLARTRIRDADGASRPRGD